MATKKKRAPKKQIVFSGRLVEEALARMKSFCKSVPSAERLSFEQKTSLAHALSKHEKLKMNLKFVQSPAESYQPNVNRPLMLKSNKRLNIAYVSFETEQTIKSAHNAMAKALHRADFSSTFMLLDTLFVATCRQLAGEVDDIQAGPLAMSLLCHTHDIYEHKGELYLLERPMSQNISEGRIHSATGPAIVWTDGKEEFYWRGVKVPSQWILDKDSVNPQLLLNEPNLELRRTLAEIIGWGPLLKQLNSKVIDKDDDPYVGSVIEATITDRDGRPTKARFLKALCGTGRTFVLHVPVTTKTAIEAQSVLWQVPESVYRKLKIRT